METASCVICESSLRAQIEEKDSLWKEAATIRWARQNGLGLSKIALVKHRVNHLQTVSGKKTKVRKISSTEERASEIVALKPIVIPVDNSSTISKTASGNGKRPRRQQKPRNSDRAETVKTDMVLSTIPPAIPDVDKEEKLKIPLKSPSLITDQLLLDSVRDQVYMKLVSGEINLSLGDGFKAIEIKHKISEESQNEKLLLEILNEIRAEELEKKKPEEVVA
jgi:hypothetical protein